VVYAAAMRSSELWDGEKIGVNVGGEPVLLARIEGQLHAYEDRCLHRQVPLSDGELRGTLLRCAVHEWEYDLRTGECVNPRDRCLRRFPVQVRDGIVYVDTGRSDGRP
jgi:toluene monooxygenase system ferredoxin subunit